MSLPVQHRARDDGGIAGGSPAAVPLHVLIGRERAAALDTRFGSAQPPKPPPEGKYIREWEHDDNGKSLMHPARIFLPDVNGHFSDLNSTAFRDRFDIAAIKSGEKKYLWTVSKLGRVIIGESTGTEINAADGKVKRLGHPVLVGGGTARISGSFRYDAIADKIYISNKSGRYGRYGDRPEAGLQAVAELLSKAGITVETRYFPQEAVIALVLPSLPADKAHCSAVDAPGCRLTQSNHEQPDSE